MISTFNQCKALVLALLCLFLATTALSQSKTVAPASTVTPISGKPPGFMDQIISWPVDGVVFQQDGNGKGQIPIIGAFYSLGVRQGLYTIRATLRPLDVKTGNPIPNATPIEKLIPDRRLFIYDLFTDATAGWYALSISFTPSRYNMEQYSFGPIKVGIGEVFIISGQSNAQGLRNVPNVPDDYKVAPPYAANTNLYDGVRVDKTLNTLNNDVANNIPDVRNTSLLGLYTPIARLTGVNSLAGVYEAGIAPTGNSLWYWAKLGEKIVNEKNVPVAFFNASWYGTTITEWERSIDPIKKVTGGGQVTGGPNDPIWGGTTEKLGLPYNLLRRTLNLYASLYGARAVLWMQGEHDNYSQNNPAFDPVTVTNWNGGPPEPYNRRVQNAADYAQKLQHIIAESRVSAPNIPWVIAKASYINGTTSSLVRDGQEQVITSGVPNILRGPDMDQIGADRRRVDGVDNVGADSGPGTEPTHLKKQGLTDAASAWFDALVGPGKLLNGVALPVTVASLGTTAQSIDISADEQTYIAPAGSTYR